VLYRFAGSAALKALEREGAILIREPADDETLGVMLASALQKPSKRRGPPERPDVSSEPSISTRRPPRRFDESMLNAIAGLQTQVACECPRHVAELLLQISSFEAYSAACVNRSSADAELHTYLEQVAGASRMLFEAALERVVLHEGLSVLPGIDAKASSFSS
jgi:hypothetical protein